MTDFDPDTSLAIVAAKYGMSGMAPLACYLVEGTNNSPDYAYFTNALNAAQNPDCHPADGTEYLMQLEGETWKAIGDISGVDPTSDCEFSRALSHVADEGARKDLCG